MLNGLPLSRLNRYTFIVFFTIALIGCGGGTSGENSTDGGVVSDNEDNPNSEDPAVPNSGPEASEFFTDPVELSHISIQSSFSDSAVVDLNADGYPDIIAGYTSGLKSGEPVPMAIYLSDGNGNITDATSELIEGELPTFNLVRDIHLADFNSDGKIDFFFSNHGKEFVDQPWPCEQNALFISQPNGKYQDVAKTQALDIADFSHGSSVGDYDGDGDTDIWVTNLGCSNTIPSYLLENDGNAQFEVVADIGNHFVGLNNILPDHSYNVFWSQFFDFNNDAVADLYYSENTHEQRILLNDGQGIFSFVDEASFANAPDGFTTQDSKAVDLNNDGYDDLILLQNPADFSAGLRFQILLNSTEGTLANITETALPNQVVEQTINAPLFFVADYEGDGDLDILAGAFGASFQPADDFYYFYINQGNQTFTRLDASELPAIRPGFIPIDLNNDQKLDFVYTDVLQEGSVSLLVTYAK